MYFRAHRAGWGADRERLLGTLLSGTRNPARWTDAVRQDHRRRRRFVQHVLQRDRGRETRAQGRLRRFGTDRSR